MKLETPIKSLFMVGKYYAQRLSKLEINTIEDLLYHFPFRYTDYSLVSPINKLQQGEIVTIEGKVLSIKNQYLRGGRKIQRAQIDDGSGKIQITWFNQPFLIRTIREGEGYRFSGKVDRFAGRLTMTSPEYERSLEQKDNIHTGRLIPIYHETAKLSSKWLRSRISWIMEKFPDQLQEFLPKKILEENNLLEFKKALKKIHFPENIKDFKEARKRFAFEELFLLHLQTLKRKESWKKEKLAFKFFIDDKKTKEFIKSLPFKLTDAQKRTIKEILGDFKKDIPMNRLLEGDVGSGKTVVAALAIYIAFSNKTQSVLMAPTGILAKQHYQTLIDLLKPFKIKVRLITGGSKTEQKDKEKTDVFVGTHALLYKKAPFEKLGLVVIDEQHRFGVEQRAKLIQKNVKKGYSPHILTMTATPIPRTIALTLYGDLSLSVIDELPPGRKKVKTFVVPPQKREDAYKWIRKRVKNTKEQCFIVCPLIEISESLQTVKAANTEYEKLKKDIFPDLKLGLLHGRMKNKEKDEVIKKFKEGKLDILISTPVVEVGIDIPQATIMVIEGSERFGLSQLHQLRGRVGRSDKKSYCLLFTEILRGKPFLRIKSLEKMNIGVELAEFDLKLRGPGEIYGTSQHGFFDLEIASLSDLDLIKLSKKVAEDIFTQINKYSLLKARLKKDTIKNIKPN